MIHEKCLFSYLVNVVAGLWQNHDAMCVCVVWLLWNHDAFCLCVVWLLRNHDAMCVCVVWLLRNHEAMCVCVVWLLRNHDAFCLCVVWLLRIWAWSGERAELQVAQHFFLNEQDRFYVCFEHEGNKLLLSVSPKDLKDCRLGLFIFYKVAHTFRASSCTECCFRFWLYCIIPEQLNKEEIN